MSSDSVVEKKVHVHDLRDELASPRLRSRSSRAYAGRDFRRTDVHGKFERDAACVGEQHANPRQESTQSAKRKGGKEGTCLPGRLMAFFSANAERRYLWKLLSMILSRYTSLEAIVWKLLFPKQPYPRLRPEGFCDASAGRRE